MENLYHASETLSGGETHMEAVKLVQPTDFEILDVLCDGERQTAPNLAEILDKRRQYMNDRLADLAANGLIEKVGPSQRSGMYVITDRGRTALKNRDRYSHSQAQEFAQLIEKEVNDIASNHRNDA